MGKQEGLHKRCSTLVKLVISLGTFFVSAFWSRVYIETLLMKSIDCLARELPMLLADCLIREIIGNQWPLIANWHPWPTLKLFPCLGSGSWSPRCTLWRRKHIFPGRGSRGTRRVARRRISGASCCCFRSKCWSSSVWLSDSAVQASPEPPWRGAALAWSSTIRS